MNKNHLILQLQEAREELDLLIKRLEGLEQKEPEGSLHISRNGKYIRFYQRTSPSDTNGRYLKKADTNLINALAGKQYHKKLKNLAAADIEKLEKSIELLNSMSSGGEQALGEIPEQFRPYVQQEDILSDKKSIAKWNKKRIAYTNTREKSISYKTSNGELVRSKSELIIAEKLKAYGVPYFYEKPLDNYPYGRLWDIFPDFTCLNTRTGRTYYWEHFGMMDNHDYCQEALSRIQNYAAEEMYPGSELILTFETNRVPLRTTYVDDLIKKFLK